MTGGIGAIFIALYTRLYVNSRNVYPYLAAPSSSIPTHVGLSVSWLHRNYNIRKNFPFPSSSPHYDNLMHFATHKKCQKMDPLNMPVLISKPK